MVQARPARRSPFRPDFPLILLVVLVVLLWVSGGASRAEVLGQVVVRAGAWTILVASILFGPSIRVGRTLPVVWLLAAIIALPLIQLIPLPPSWWQALPGRDILLIPGERVDWRPWTMTPGATRNALASLIVPAVTLVVLTQQNDRARQWLPAILVAMIGSAMLLGLLQFSGSNFNSPFLNDTPGGISSIFANRNHFALFLAIGCLVTPVWAFSDREAMRWRGPLACSLVLLFVLTILATGSRSGMLLGALALVVMFTLVGRMVKQHLRRAPRWMFPALLVGAAIVIGSAIALSFAADRADAINRFISLDSAEDMRSRARPTVLSMIALYMPVGSGFGGFDPIFRIHEPFELLKLTYFNQAHNDFLGIVLDGGVFGMALLATGVLWWLNTTVRVWRSEPNEGVLLGRLGSAIILLVLAASITDYPARTPTIMAILVISAFWLAEASASPKRTALPARPTKL